MPVAPPPMTAGDVVAPPPVAADGSENVVAAPPPAADGAENVVAAPPSAEDDAETLVAPPPERTNLSVTDAEEEEPLQGEINKHAFWKRQSREEMWLRRREIYPWEMLNWNVEEGCYMGSRIGGNREFGDLSDPSVVRASDDHSDESDHSDDGCAYPSNYEFSPWYGHYPIYRGRDKRRGSPCHCCDHRRNHRNNGFPHWSGSINLHNPMASVDIGLESRWFPPEPDLAKKRYAVGAALSNPYRWTCFVNCILQCMVHTVPLVLKLQKADHPDPCPRASIGFCCYCSLKLHAAESIRLSGSVFYPESFVNNLQSIFPKFERGQQDAHEFLRCLLDKLDETSVAPRSSLDEPSSTEECSVAKETFGGRMKSQLRCPGCNHSSDRSEPFLDLSLGIDMVDTLVDAMQSFTKVEVIEGVMCDGCKSRVDMEKQLKIEQAPEVLVIHLKRFLYSGYDTSKIWDKVKYPLELDINPFMSSSDDTLQKYDLYGIVEHYGTYARGHYVGYIRSSQSDWYKFDDDKVSRYYEADVLNSTSYILFYVKQGSSPWFSTLLEREDKLPLDGSVSMAEQGSGESALINNKEEESLSSRGQDSSDCCLGGPAEENGNGLHLLDLSRHLQSDGNDNTLSVAPDKLGGCSLSVLSGGTHEVSCLTGSSGKNGLVDGRMEPSENKDDGSPRGSLDMKEVNRSTHGSTEVDNAGTQEGSPRKNDNTLSLLQTSHKHEDNCYHENETGLCSGAPSGRMGCTSEKKTTVESTPTMSSGTSTTVLLRASANSSSGWEEGRGGRRKRRRKSTDGGGGDESEASRKRKRRKQRAVARRFDLCRRRALVVARKSKKWRR